MKLKDSWIICDTNVWKKIKHKEIKLRKEYKLICTWLTIEELLKATRYTNDYTEFRDTLQTIFKYAELILPFPALDYLIFLDKNHYTKESSDNLKYLKILEVAIKTNLEFDFLKEFKADLTDWEHQYQILSDSFNSYAFEVRKEISDSKTYSQNNFLEENKYIILKWCQSKTQQVLSKNIEWNKIELFVKAVDLFLLNLETTDMKQDVNTIFDLLNLVFVSPNIKYWTFDNKKLYHILKSKKELSKYFV